MKEVAARQAAREQEEARNGIGPDEPLAGLPPAPAPETHLPKAGEVTIQPESVVQVSVKEEIVQEGTKDILVLGEVNRQEGVYRFDNSTPCTLLHLIFKMEGFPDFADTRAIRIIRRDDGGIEEEIRVDASSILEDGSPEHDVPLENGDRVIVPARRFSLFN